MEDGRVKSQDTTADVSSTDLMFDRTPTTEDEASEEQTITVDEKPILNANGATPAPARTGLLVAKEEISEGHVGFEACGYTGPCATYICLTVFSQAVPLERCWQVAHHLVDRICGGMRCQQCA
jgi:hypothetical protein